MEKNNLIIIKEGSIKFYIPKIDIDSIPSKSMSVFYNKKMIINRDISSLAIQVYNKLYKQDLVIVDSMAASGISSIRLLKECNNIRKIYINDINPLAVELIKKSIKLNKLNKKSFQIEVSRKDANYLFSEIAQKNHISLKYKNEEPNIISIDPFGTPNLYINSAFNTIQREKGLMCITATDTAVLHGVRPKACLRKYMSKSLHNEYSKEIGARILIYFASRIANVNKIGIKPLLTFSSGHFIRIFLLTYKSKAKISKDFTKYGYVIHCKCGYRTINDNNILKIPKICPICHSSDKFDFAGPLWLGELHDETFLKELIIQNNNSDYQNEKRINKVLNFALDELNMPVSYYNIHKLCQNLKLQNIPKIVVLLNSIKQKGFVASRTHFDPLAIKTNMDIDSIKQFLKTL
ncbi:MAG: tRNA (guanine(10)-N(2))-dimethyltransferase [Promethearchaeota archaeon]